MNLKGIYYKEPQVLEIWDEKEKVHTAVVEEGQDFWTGANIHGVEYDINLWVDMSEKPCLAIYDCEKIDENTYQTTYFITGLNLEVI